MSAARETLGKWLIGISDPSCATLWYWTGAEFRTEVERAQRYAYRESAESYRNMQAAAAAEVGWARLGSRPFWSLEPQAATCEHIEYRNTLDGGVCLDCGAELEAEEER